MKGYRSGPNIRQNFDVSNDVSRHVHRFVTCRECPLWLRLWHGRQPSTHFRYWGGSPLSLFPVDWL